ncbi:SDR family NAD(P)-dependent oxidoreductase [Nocardioides humi]|uniref:SDR family oxidoreductase n=1 Tax=Nocardioides humi TaxID=449461 RepID=A0ABN2A7D0_9ACTN|nr:SDR family oxidoreductase [Nocardioides humi]
MTDLTGRTALVTGGSSGNGRAIALALGRAGASVVVADLRPEPRESGVPTAEQLQAEGHQALFVRCDVADEAAMVSAVEATRSFGDLDVMVNNAGVLHLAPITELSCEDFDRIHAVNARGTFLGCREAARVMVARGHGTIVNVASVAALRGARGYAAYAASKGAVTAMTRALAAELGPAGVRVNCLVPGYVDTAMTRADIATEDKVASSAERIPIRRVGRPDDMAAAVLFLADHRASGFLHGSSVVVDGGISAVL